MVRKTTSRASSDIDNARSKGRVTLLVSLDASKGFGDTLHVELREKLSKIGIPGKIVRAIMLVLRS